VISATREVEEVFMGLLQGGETQCGALFGSDDIE
jgi:hypothetical protein